MVDYRSRSRRTLAYLLRTPPQATAALRGRTAHGTLVAFQLPTGAFLVLSVQGEAAGPHTLTLRIGEAEWRLPSSAADGVCWCGFFTRTLPREEAVSVETAQGARIAAGRLRAAEHRDPGLPH